MEQKDGQNGVSEQEFEQLLYQITHDLRACFRAVRTIPEWIREDARSGIAEETLSEHLDMLLTPAERGDQILLDLRSYSRIGRMSESPARHRIDRLVSAACVTLDWPEDFSCTLEGGGLELFGPEADLVQMFAAIMGNSIKHHDRPTGQVNIVAAQTPEGVTISIQDDGPGIPPQFHDKVFDLMTTLRPRDVCEGSGVGLALARKILRSNGGGIRLAEADGERGTTVQIRMPVPVAKPANAVTPPQDSVMAALRAANSLQDERDHAALPRKAMTWPYGKAIL